MNSAIKYKLFLMMVLEFFIWGAWLPLIFGYLPSLGFSPGQTPARDRHNNTVAGQTHRLPGFSRNLRGAQNSPTK